MVNKIYQLGSIHLSRFFGSKSVKFAPSFLTQQNHSVFLFHPEDSCVFFFNRFCFFSSLFCIVCCASYLYLCFVWFGLVWFCS